MVQAIDEVEQKDLAQAFRLLGEMNTSVLQVNELVDNMLIRVKNGEISTDTGECIEGDPSIDRLIEIRTVLERIRPIDHKLKYQINKLVKTAVTGTTDNSDPSKFKANPDALLVKLDSFDEESGSEEVEEQMTTQTKQSKKSNVYVPPKLAAVHYDGEDNLIQKIRKAGERARRRSVSGAVLRELKEEYLDAPVEDMQGLSEKQASLGRENKRKIEYEEHYMTRLPITKQDKHRRRQVTTLGTLGDEITSFGESSSILIKKKKIQKNGKGKKSFKRKRYQ